MPIEQDAVRERPESRKMGKNGKAASPVPPPTQKRELVCRRPQPNTDVTDAIMENHVNYFDASGEDGVAGAGKEFSPFVIWLRTEGDRLAVAMTRLRFWVTSVVFNSSRRALLAGSLESWVVTSRARVTMV